MNYFDQVQLGQTENIMALLGDERRVLTDLEKKVLFKQNVEIVNLETSYVCNRKCDYCPVAGSDRHLAVNSSKHLDREIVDDQMPSSITDKIARQLSDIRYENRLSLNLYNEPLLDPHLEKQIETLREACPYSHIAFNSNGDFLNAERLRALSAAGVDAICITLHPKPHQKVSGSEIERRLSSIFKRLDTPPPQPQFVRQMNEAHVKKRVQGVSVKIQWPDWREIGTNRAGTLSGHITSSTRRVNPCVKPFREFTVFYDGEVQPCCECYHDEDRLLIKIGNVHDQSIFDLYSSVVLGKFRRNVFCFGEKSGICASCSSPDWSIAQDDIHKRRILSSLTDTSG